MKYLKTTKEEVKQISEDYYNTICDDLNCPTPKEQRVTKLGLSYDEDLETGECELIINEEAENRLPPQVKARLSNVKAIIRQE